MHQAAQAYSQTARTTISPRELEASLLIKAASRIQKLKDDWPSTSTELYEVLYFNRKLWTILVTSATKEDNPLPDAIKQNIANLAMFVFDRTVEIQIHPEVESLSILVTINREIAAGLQS